MKKIDSYILKKFLSSFVFCLILFTVIVVIVDTSEKTDDFAKSKLSFWQIVNQYHLGFVPHIDAMLFPLFVFIAVIFFTAKMAGRSEVVAILSSGVSFRRFLLPYWIGGILLSSILWLVYHFVLPPANQRWGEFQAKYIDKNYYTPVNKSRVENYYFRLDSNTYAALKGYDTTSKTGSRFFVQHFKNNQLDYNLRAELLMWDTTYKKWKLTTVSERFLDGEKENVIRSTSKLVTYNFKPNDLRKDDYVKDRLPTPELDHMIAMERLRGGEGINDLLVERYNRDSIPISVLILTLIGAIIASQKVRGGSGFHLAVGIVISVLYILLGRFSLVFATKGNFTPWLAAWIPNMVFAIVAYYFYRRNAR